MILVIINLIEDPIHHKVWTENTEIDMKSDVLRVGCELAYNVHDRHYYESNENCASGCKIKRYT